MSSARSTNSSSQPQQQQRYSGSTGAYNVQAYEAAQEKKHSTVNVSVVLLDQSEVVFKISKRDRGQVLLDLVFQHARIGEVKFFGLQFPSSMLDSMRWIDPTKSIRKQFKRGFPHILFLRIKFYATDLAMMKEAITKYNLFLQLKLDLLERRLVCPPDVAAFLASLALQSELGDYDDSTHGNTYVSEFKFIANQTTDFEAEVRCRHQLNQGMTPYQAEVKFIQTAQTISMYGVEMHIGYDSDDCRLDIGVDGSGVIITQNGCMTKEFKWSTIVKISFKRKQFFIQLKPQLGRSEPANLITTFHMDCYRSCKRLWKSCVDFHSFYRQTRCLNNSCAHQPTPEENDISNARPVIAMECEEIDERAEELRKALEADQIRPSSRFSFSNAHNHRSKSRQSRSNENLSPETYNARHNKSITNITHEDKAPRRLSAPPTVVSVIGGHTGYTDEELANAIKLQQGTTQAMNGSNESLASKKSSSTERLPTPVMLPIHYHTFEAPPIGTITQHFPTKQELNQSSEAVAEDPSISDLTDNISNLNQSASKVPHHAESNNGGMALNIVYLKLQPDQDGRYGFNVKGGTDQNMDIVISKVAKGLPASKCDPPIQIGDRVLQVNGRDVSHHTHDQIVRFIQSTRESHTGHLTLMLEKPPMYDVSTEQEFPAAVAQTTMSDLDSSCEEKEVPQLQDSIEWLESLLVNDDILNMFEQLYRRKPSGTFENAKMHHNLHKNRYRDISPYDDTRVILNDDQNDYINANYVDMEIPGASYTNHYIACQGPLHNTAVDFWTMVWERKSTFIVMLTALMERARTKCYQYWPDEGCTIKFGNWLVESISEESSDSFAFRDFYLHNCYTDEDGSSTVFESRKIKQMQYIAWPDHGVPDDSSDFLDFVLRVRQNRVGMEVPSIIHCSAGIGRTGVLITMETAMCLIEENQPVYPVEIAKSMRDQRAMMIQTSGQFKFVCEAILRVYREGLAKPLKYCDMYHHNNSSSVNDGGSSNVDGKSDDEDDSEVNGDDGDLSLSLGTLQEPVDV